MKKKIFFFTAAFLFPVISFAQNRVSEEEKIAKLIHNVLSENKYPKDSLLIYAFNFELSISKKNGKTLVSDIIANDSLAYEMFPAYKKLKTINFTPLTKGRSSIKVIIPIIIFGSSEKQKKYKDKEGGTLINFNAAVNAAITLNDPIHYSNEHDATKAYSYKIHNKNNKALFIDAIFMRPYIIEIFNIE